MTKRALLELERVTYYQREGRASSRQLHKILKPRRNTTSRVEKCKIIKTIAKLLICQIRLIELKFELF
jgi:cell division protein FtsL